MDRNEMISRYLEYLDLGDSLYEADCRKVMRKTTVVTKDGFGRVTTEYTQEEIEFS